MSERAGEARAKDVASALHDVAALGGFFVLSTTMDRHAGPHESGQLSPAVFAALAETVNERYATDEARIGVSIAHLGLAARLWSPVLACTLLHGIVLDLSSLQWSEGGPALHLADPVGRYTTGLPSVSQQMYAEVNQRMEALENQLAVKISPRLLDGNMASALLGSASMLLRTQPDLRAPLTHLTMDLLATGRLRGTGHITGPDLTFRRRSCCLYYRAPGGGKCGDCCLVN
ncbi:(2Fe-2S)-binding protein [Streptomyces sp. NPDC053560]|uniref:(2Fe-2S)-binding protein n=1 Tax=Streptomyces sp. NPDC053560 TaxID=3365711 RepID=UPI0037D2B144